MKIACAIIFCCFVAACNAKPHVVSKATLAGPEFKATLVAYSKFTTQLSAESRYGELGLFLSKIDNYDLYISEGNDSYLIKFIPRLYEGRHLKGGGAEYVISKNDYSILKFLLYK